MAIGLMGGTFNPIHIAHLIIAEWIKDEWNLDKIVFIPAGNPPHKSKNNLLKSNIRYNLVDIATSSNSSFEISNFEIEKEEVSYTIDTISYFRNRYPDEKLFFIVGADTLFQLEYWKGFKELAKMVEFITYSRWGYNKLEIEDRINRLNKDYGFQIYYSNGPEIQISSSNIRDRLKEGLSIKYMVPDLVILDIQNKGLYKGVADESFKE
jgi:nicotinate-nucleotide adenylyltransferase